MESYVTAEISASAITSNLSLLRQCVPPATRLCAVVKADCYGHGLELLLPAITKVAQCLAVATPEEALAVRRLGYTGPVVMFFSACAHADGQERRDALAELIRQQITLTLVSAEELAAVAQAARTVGAAAQVQVKVDSGMGRSGIAPEALPPLVTQIHAARDVNLTGLYTHFATADDAAQEFALHQLERFTRAAAACGTRNGLLLHAANSAAVIDLPPTHLDMVRPGLAIYGYQPADPVRNHLPLRPALRLTGRLMQVKTLPAGATCGYGRTHTCPHESRVGLVPIGYGDGYFRCLSNKAQMRVAGRFVRICGRVSMDQIIIDLTDAPAARVGSEVEIISNDPAAPHSVENLARLAGTIPYEVTCRLGPRVQRKLVE